MNSEESIFWVDVLLKEQPSESNHREFIKNLNDSVKRVVTSEESIPGAKGKKVGIRIICEAQPNQKGIDQLSFIKSGFKHQKIPFSVCFRSANGLDEMNIPESAHFNDLSSFFDGMFEE